MQNANSNIDRRSTANGRGNNLDSVTMDSILSTKPIQLSFRDSKYDIRSCAPNHEKADKGITLTEEELRKLKKLIDMEISLLDADVYKAGLSK